MPCMCSWKCPLRGHFQCHVCIAANAPYRGISSALHVYLEMPPAKVLPVPHLCYSKCPLWRHFQCMFYFAVHSQYRGISYANYAILYMLLIAGFTVLSFNHTIMSLFNDLLFAKSEFLHMIFLVVIIVHFKDSGLFRAIFTAS